MIKINAFRREAIEGYLIILPWLIGLVLFQAGPILASFGLMFTDWNMLSPAQWVGLANIRRLFTDRYFIKAIQVTCRYCLFAIPLGIGFAFVIALLLNQGLKGIAFWRTVYYLPAVVSGVGVALMWSWIFNPDFGLINSALAAVGIKGPKWLYSTVWALPSLIIMSVWGAGGSMVIYLSGLQGIPTELYEAASIDGANARQRLWHITLPMMTPVIFFQLIMGLINSFQYFTQAFVMTGGGPNNATLFYVLYLYRTAFERFRMGYAATLGVVLFWIILALAAILMRTSKYWVFYEAEERGR